jgi:hypothetical protein
MKSYRYIIIRCKVGSNDLNYLVEGTTNYYRGLRTIEENLKPKIVIPIAFCSAKIGGNDWPFEDPFDQNLIADTFRALPASSVSKYLSSTLPSFLFKSTKN